MALTEYQKEIVREKFKSKIEGKSSAEIKEIIDSYKGEQKEMIKNEFGIPKKNTGGKSK